MKRDHFLRHLLAALLLALTGYALVFQIIEHRRTRQGPWVVTFTSFSNGTPSLIFDQEALGITNVQVVLDEAPPQTNGVKTVRFAQARTPPFPTPFGRCVFLNTTSLPGTVVLEVVGTKFNCCRVC
jgi:hypothetical protein